MKQFGGIIVQEAPLGPARGSVTRSTSDCNRAPRIPTAPDLAKPLPVTAPRSVTYSTPSAFTLMELLVVIAIISILAGLLLPVLARYKLIAKINTTRQDMKNLEAAVYDYRALYTWLPGTGISTGGRDVTYGLVTNGRGNPSNADVLASLMDLDSGINLHHAKNPQHHIILSPARAQDAKSHGLSSVDNQYRDPWGHPYVITLDGDGDEYCDDALYSLRPVSGSGAASARGEHGLVDPVNHGAGPFLLHRPVMIWSLGPDGQATTNTNANPNPDVNKDNLLGWL